MGAPTDRTTDGNHLQMTALQPPLQRRVGRVGRSVLDIEDITIGSSVITPRDLRIGIALEAVNDAPAQAGPGSRSLAVRRRNIVVGAHTVLWHRFKFMVLLHAAPPFFQALG